tara:strand:- start:132 stop:359 length:228 start_codon:yes stop_codon:yes gene_type:complete
MFEAQFYVWHESDPNRGWDVGLLEDGRISLTLRRGSVWSARPLQLDLDLPQGVFDALIKHKGETRRHLATLMEVN